MHDQTAIVERAYMEVLKRQPDEEGREYYVRSGQPFDKLCMLLRESDEFRRRCNKGQAEYKKFSTSMDALDSVQLERFDCSGFPVEVRINNTISEVDFFFSFNNGFTRAVSFLGEQGRQTVFLRRGVVVGWILASDYAFFRESLLERELFSYHYKILDHAAKVSGAAKGRTAAYLGTNRLGDFFSQLNWLSLYVEKTKSGEWDDFIDYIFIGQYGLFFDVKRLFPEFESKFFECTDNFEAASHCLVNKLFCGLLDLSSNKRNYLPLASRLRSIVGSAGSFPIRGGEIKVLLSFDIEKRVWTNAAECVAAVWKELSERYSKVIFIINGMTGYVNKERDEGIDKVIAAEKKAIENFFSGLRGELLDLSGADALTKAAQFTEAALYIAPIGSATMLPSLLLGLPGIAVGNTHMIGDTFYRSFVGEGAVLPSLNDVVDVPDVSGEISWHKPQETISYRVSPRFLVEALVSIVESRSTRR